MRLSYTNKYSIFRTDKIVWCIALIFCVVYVTPAPATPPDYQSFDRNQLVNYQPNETDLLRIWMIDIGQGDGMLIELPSKFRYDPDPNDDSSERTENIEIFIDGGSKSKVDASRALAFLRARFPDKAILEYVVITHHDEDHIKGLINILNSTDFSVEHIFHNGLASYRPDKDKFASAYANNQKIRGKKSGGKYNKFMARVTEDKLLSADLVDNLQELQILLNDKKLQGIYERLAKSIMNKVEPASVTAFQRYYDETDFINQVENSKGRGVDLSGIIFEPLWPLKRLDDYKDWGKTINGNSITFRMDYGNFSMLFTGDHNKESEEKLLSHLVKNTEINKLKVDVFKVPHHASSHYSEEFIDEDIIDPIISIASMGTKGFKSKALGNKNNWQHPNTELIKRLGGHHRVYLTHIHEKLFKWDALTTKKKHQDMVERNHILIETDGEYFRVVEVDSTSSVLEIPTVKKTRRSNGTRWIKAN